jgi:hypothetical protein
LLAASAAFGSPPGLHAVNNGREALTSRRRAGAADGNEDNPVVAQQPQVRDPTDGAADGGGRAAPP